ncbi:MAG: HEPN domain-containing protein [Candidatus Firestonebacteria bacterium]|nr:HEPN domain-containing protein [Candidatus Firestonebacteria bacterium]
MSFNWQEYITLANNLIKNPCSGNEESYYRSAISRAYYGVFGIAKMFVIKSGVSLPPQNTHQFLINNYKNSSDSVRKKIGKNLDSLRRDRNKADYEDNISLNFKYAETSYKNAEQILKDLKNIGAI